jgi:hypothetical protein
MTGILGLIYRSADILVLASTQQFTHTSNVNYLFILIWFCLRYMFQCVWIIIGQSRWMNMRVHGCRSITAYGRCGGASLLGFSTAMETNTGGWTGSWSFPHIIQFTTCFERVLRQLNCTRSFTCKLNRVLRWAPGRHTAKSVSATVLTVSARIEQSEQRGDAVACVQNCAVTHFIQQDTPCQHRAQCSVHFQNVHIEQCVSGTSLLLGHAGC